MLISTLQNARAVRRGKESPPKLQRVPRLCCWFIAKYVIDCQIFWSAVKIMDFLIRDGTLLSRIFILEE